MSLESGRSDISLVIPAWNEAAYLPRLLDTIDVAKGHYRHGPDRIEIVVADNGSTDETPQIATARGCYVEHVPKRLIAAARNGGAAAARGEILAFADADFRLHPETFNYIDSVMQHPGYIGGATGITMERWSLGIAVTWYLIMPPLWLYGIDGGVWFCRRSDFQGIGGYNETVPLGEDVEFLRRLKRRGAGQRSKQKLATRFTARKISVANPYFLLWWATVGLTLTSQAMEYGLFVLVLFVLVHWMCDLGWLEVLSFAGFKGSQAFGNRSQQVISMTCAVVLLGFGVKFIYDAAIGMG